jgi:hypothetical protein
MKIALIITAFEGELPTFSTKPYSLLSISSYLKTKNIDSDIFDFTDVITRENDIHSSIKKFGIDEYDLIGFSAYFENYESSKIWAGIIKQLNLYTHITIGGYCPTIAHEYIINNDFCFDSAIRGYGEKAFYQLYLSLNGIINLPEVSNLTYRSEMGNVITNTFIEFEELDEIGIINEILVKNKNYEYEIIFDQKDNLWRTKVPIIASRGCPFPCFFCLNRVITKKYTVSPLQLVIYEIEAAISGIQYPLITFWDPNFLIKEDLFMGILQYLKDNKIPFTFGTTVSQLLKNRTRLNTFVEMGLRTIEVGIENVNDDINKLELGKVQFARDCWELIDVLSSMEVYCVVDFINYTAKSEIEHIKNNISFLKFYYNKYPLQEYYHFSTFESQLCYYVGSKSFELLQKDLNFNFIPTQIYYSANYFYDENVALLFKYYKKFSEKHLCSIDLYYADEFDRYQKKGILEKENIQDKLKAIRDIPICWYESAFRLFEIKINPEFQEIIDSLLESNPNYVAIFDSITNFSASIAHSK